MIRKLVISALILFNSCKSTINSNQFEADVIIYGATSSGIIAGVQISRMGKSIIIIEPSSHIGGLTSSGLGQTDIGNKHVIGGIALEFYARIAEEYQNEEAWNFQSKKEYEAQPKRLIGNSQTESASYTGNAMWTFEPKVAAKVFNDLLKEHKIKVITNGRLDLNKGVIKDGTKIQNVVMESGNI